MASRSLLRLLPTSFGGLDARRSGRHGGRQTLARRHFPRPSCPECPCDVPGRLSLNLVQFGCTYRADTPVLHSAAVPTGMCSTPIVDRRELKRDGAQHVIDLGESDIIVPEATTLELRRLGTHRARRRHEKRSLISNTPPDGLKELAGAFASLIRRARRAPMTRREREPSHGYVRQHMHLLAPASQVTGPWRGHRLSVTSFGRTGLSSPLSR